MFLKNILPARTELKWMDGTRTRKWKRETFLNFVHFFQFKFFGNFFKLGTFLPV